MMVYLQVIYIAILTYIICLDLGYIVLLIASIKDIFIGFREHDASKIVTFIEEFPMPATSILIPVYNGEDLILETIAAVLKCKNSKYLTIIVINDGSTDNTLHKLIDAFDLHKFSPNIPNLIKVRKKVRAQYFSKHVPNLMVIDKDNGGKSDALNAALNVCHTPLFLTLDHDTLLEHETIYRLVLNFFRRDHTVVVGGGVYILNGCEYKNGAILRTKVSSNLMCAVQTCEYLRSFLFGRVGWNPVGGSLCYAGALTLFELKSVIDVGGFDYNNTGQDFEIIVNLQAERYKKHMPTHLTYAPSAIAWTGVPTTLTEYWKQRTFWQIGSLKSLFRHKYMLFNPKYGFIGLVTYPFFLIGEILSPVLIFIGYIIGLLGICFNYLDIKMFVLILFASVGLALSITVATILISFATYNRYPDEQDRVKLLFAVLVESLGVKQILIICQTIATFRYFFNKKLRGTWYQND